MSGGAVDKFFEEKNTPEAQQQLQNNMSSTLAWAAGIKKPSDADAKTLTDAGVEAGKKAAQEDGFEKLSSKEQAKRVVDVIRKNEGGEFNAAHAAIARASGGSKANEERIFQGAEDSLAEDLQNTKPALQAAIKVDKAAQVARDTPAAKPVEVAKVEPAAPTAPAAAPEKTPEVASAPAPVIAPTAPAPQPAVTPPAPAAVIANAPASGQSSGAPDASPIAALGSMVSDAATQAMNLAQSMIPKEMQAALSALAENPTIKMAIAEAGKVLDTAMKTTGMTVSQATETSPLLQTGKVVQQASIGGGRGAGGMS